ncbi:hypothetical protein DOJK_01169 [Patescibacteria group bacterium]|nr:hypothetical protein DOJK_01169 [Patescibacteria group bacterium]
MNKFILLILLLNFLYLSNTWAVSCIVNSSGLNFGSFNVLTDNNADSMGTISVACDASTSYTIELSQGNSGAFTVRRMTNGGYSLEYNLYTDATYQSVWGNGIAGSMMVSGSTSDTLPTNHTVYGRIPLNTQRSAMSGSYNDSITITVTY